MDTPNTNKLFWDSRASLGRSAGSQDLILHELEVAALKRHIQPGQRVLDIGCGNGLTAIELVQSLGMQIIGVDYSEAMIGQAMVNRDAMILPGEDYPNPLFMEGNVLQLPELRNGTLAEPFDTIYTKRCLINLGSWEEQRQAIESIGGLLKPGGRFLMVESCEEGLRGVNAVRAQVGLPPVVPLARNRYLRIGELSELSHESKTIRWVNTYNFSGLYYLLSRVVNAKLAADEGREPVYDSPINQLALSLSPNIVSQWGQTMMFCWERREDDGGPCCGLHEGD